MSTVLTASALIIRPSLVLVVAFGAALALRSASAATRHLVWSVALLGALLVPIASVWVPRWHVEAPKALNPIVGRVLPAGAGAAVGGAGDPAHEPLGTIIGSPAPARLTWIWLGGALTLLASVVIHSVRLHRLERDLEEVSDGALAETLDTLRRRLNLRSRVRLLVGGVDAMPMTWGYTTSRILVPAGVRTWPQEQVEAVLLHELAHVRRRDVIVHAIAEVARAVYWFNPLAWYAARRLLIERERACDDEAILSGLKPSEYAHQLLEMTHTLRAARATTRVSMAMARPSQMTGRLLAVLDRERSRWRRSTLGVVAACAGALVLVGSAAAVQPLPGRSSSPRVELPLLATDVVPEAAVPPRGEVPTSQRSSMTSGCWVSLRGTNSNRNRDRSRQVAEWRTPGCSGSLLFDVPIAVDPDTTRIVYVRGEFRLTEIEGSIRRVIRAVRVEGDGPGLSGTVNGRAVPVSTVVDWLAQNLRSVLRLTGVLVDVSSGP